jgi:hypothetical protein
MTVQIGDKDNEKLSRIRWRAGLNPAVQARAHRGIQIMSLGAKDIERKDFL